MNATSKQPAANGNSSRKTIVFSEAMHREIKSAACTLGLQLQDVADEMGRLWLKSKRGRLSRQPSTP